VLAAGRMPPLSRPFRTTRLGRPRVVYDPAPMPTAITQEMIEAGAIILDEYGGLGPYTARHLAEDVYRAMTECAAASKVTD
jgi:hypothetical protein